MPKKMNQIVKESNALARARVMPVSSTVWTERIIAAIAAKNRIDDLTFKEHLIDIENLFPSATENLSASQYSELKKAVEHLTRSYFQIRKSNGDFMNYPIFSKIGIKDNYIIGKFNSDLAEHYLELKKQFAIRVLPEFQVLSGTYSQQLFRYLNSWKDRIETTIPLSELHETLVVPASFRKDFKAFRIRVLETAHKEITEKTSLHYEWEPVKKGLRKIIAVRFIFDIARSTAAEAERQATQEKENALKTTGELQRLSNQCWERLQRLKKECTPKKS
ncbi:MAG: replication initiation protein, partial [Holosporales bacterium]|nr:replication initiation protein [Holosporales bacterium]